MTEPITYAERRAAGTFDAARTAELVEPTPPATVDNRTHVPLGSDVELYSQIAGWAPEIAGFRRFDIAHDTPGVVGAPGVELAVLDRADVVLDSYLFVLEPFDGNQPAGYLALTGLDTYAQSFTIDSLNDWQGYGEATVGEGLFGVRDPLVFWSKTTVSFYIGDNQGDDPGSSQGRLVLVLRVLPAPPTYPGV